LPRWRKARTRKRAAVRTRPHEGKLKPRSRRPRGNQKKPTQDGFTNDGGSGLIRRERKGQRRRSGHDDDRAELDEDFDGGQSAEPADDRFGLKLVFRHDRLERKYEQQRP
jgi:hypothetical protein